MTEEPVPSTRLAQLVSRALHRHKEQHRPTNSLRDVILGGQDGLVNILGIILGAAAVGFLIGRLFHAAG